MRTLYICYFGLREPLVQTQVLPYLRQLSRRGVGVNLLTFEPDMRRAWPADEKKMWRARLQTDGIRWSMLSYHKRLSMLATLYDVLKGAWVATRLTRRYGINVLHARSHIPMLMAMLIRRWTNCGLVFDLRGLIADEYVDAGVWVENSLPFRAVKAVERAGLRRADQVVVLTKRMRDWLVEEGLVNAEKIEVVPCCVDFVRFSDNKNSEAAPEERFELVYAGAATGLYLFEEMGRFFLALKRRVPNAFFRVMTTSPAADAAAVLRRIGLSNNDFWIGSVSPLEVPEYLRRARIGLSFRKATFAQIAASPTKIPEYLAAGLPTVSNAGIGDTDDLLEKEKVGVIVRGFEDRDYLNAVDRVLALLDDPELRARCSLVARRRFDLVQVGGERYLNLYRRLNEQRGGTTTSVSEASL